jgi:hypothetical protein
MSKGSAVLFAVTTVSLSFSGSLANAQVDLNAPFKPKPSTIATEIRRGFDASFACMTSNVSPPDPDLERFWRCVNSAHEHNRQSMSTGFEAFDVGLYSFSEGLLKSITDSDLAPSNAQTAALGYQEARDKVGITDQQVNQALVATK